MANPDSFGARSRLAVGEREVELFRLDALQERFDVLRLPYTLRILLENVLRNENGVTVTADDVEAVAGWVAAAEPSQAISFTPGRVLHQDFTGVPAIVDLAAMRNAMADLGGEAARINPLLPSELVIDHSVQVDEFATPFAIRRNSELEFERNRERYAFLRWGQSGFVNFKVVPPATGIVHQVNLEFLARVVMTRNGQAYPDTLVGTDSHTTMVNGLGVLGWGVGGIEAEAAMLGQPVSMLIPQVVGFKLTGSLPTGTTATDLVLTITEMLRKHGVVGKFVEFYGEGVAAVPLANRATIGNMSPEFGSTAAIFPIDEETINYLRLTGRADAQLALVEAYAKEQGLWHDAAHEPRYSEYLELDLSTVVPSIAGPKRPQDRIALSDAKQQFLADLPAYVSAREEQPQTTGSPVDEASAESFPASDAPAYGHSENGVGKPSHTAIGSAADGLSNPVQVTGPDGKSYEIDHGAVAVAAITSCTNTSNPYVMVGAALVAKKAVEKGLTRKPWVKTTLAPGSQVVMDYYDRAGLTPYLDKLGFNLVGYGCTTCIGNSGPLPEEISQAVNDNDLAVAAVLSGNRNFEGRINPDVKMNYLASPPLVVAYAIAGSMKVDITTEQLGTDQDGNPVHLADLWPSEQEVEEVVASCIGQEMFTKDYADVFAGDEQWQALPVPTGNTFEWDPESTYVRKPPYFDGMGTEPAPVEDISGARVLAKLGDSVTTDHISPAGAIKADTPAGQYLTEHSVARRDFNSYGSRRGNHEVMIRGTFANIRLRNEIAEGTEGGYTRDFTQPDSPVAFIYDASQNYQSQGIPLVVLAGKEYGSGSSRDWAAKGTALLGVKAVIAESYERIHRSNLIGMGVLPLQFPAGQTAASLGLSGEETFSFAGITALNDGGVPETVKVSTETGVEFDATLRIDTPGEADYYRNGGIMQYVLRSLLRK
ncbi:MAG: aconitate hydratase [Streptomyces sp.]|uniref:aconitate hydratase n=1 Tax=Streptomyces sp. TaxID=1931 RepID=UPI003D6A5925